MSSVAFLLFTAPLCFHLSSHLFLVLPYPPCLFVQLQLLAASAPPVPQPARLAHVPLDWPGPRDPPSLSQASARKGHKRATPAYACREALRVRGSAPQDDREGLCKSPSPPPCWLANTVVPCGCRKDDNDPQNIGADSQDRRLRSMTFARP
jgi:hypothetical protein